MNDKQLVVVDGKIERFQEKRDLIVGYLVKPDWPDSKTDSAPGVKPGYFILDTKDGAVEKGLSEKDWQRQLDARGVKEVHLQEVRHPFIPCAS